MKNELMRESDLSLLIIMGFILLMWVVASLAAKVSKAAIYADNFRPSTRPSWMAVNTKTGKLEGGYISDKELWRRVFWSKLFERGF